MDISQIITGWTNLTLEQFDLLNPEIKQLSTQRLKLCNNCPMRVNNKCDSSNTQPAVKDFIYAGEYRHKDAIYSGCGCNLSAKTLVKEAQCPVGKW